MRRGNPLAVSIMYQDVTGEALRRLSTSSGSSADLSQGTCPLCVAEDEDMDLYAGAMAEALRDMELRAAFEATAGLCLRHLMAVLERTSGETRLFLVEHERTALMRLWAELAEFVRKSDARYRHEPMGRESDAWIRALLKFGGRITYRRNGGHAR